jgi:hypothetical protein
VRNFTLIIMGLITPWLLPSPGASETVASTANLPLILEAKEADGMVEVLVRTNAAAAQTVSYALQVAGGSRTSHQGRTRIVPGTSQTISTVRFNATPAWGVRLKVEPEGGAAYEQVLGDPAVL